MDSAFFATYERCCNTDQGVEDDYESDCHPGYHPGVEIVGVNFDVLSLREYFIHLTRIHSTTGTTSYVPSNSRAGPEIILSSVFQGHEARWILVVYLLPGK